MSHLRFSAGKNTTGEQNLNLLPGIGIVFLKSLNCIEGRNSNLRGKMPIKCVCMSQNLTESCQKAVKRMSNSGSKCYSPPSNWAKVVIVDRNKRVQNRHFLVLLSDSFSVY